MSQIAAALATFTADLATKGATYATALHGRMVQAHGPRLATIGCDFTYAEAFSRTIRPLCTYVDGCPVLDADKVATWAAQWAAAQIADVAAKLEAKVPGLEDVHVVSAHDGWITLTGTRNGCRVRVEQGRITNVSSKGNLYNQWPAHVYVDGKKVAAADFVAATSTPTNERHAAAQKAWSDRNRRLLDAAKARLAAGV